MSEAFDVGPHPSARPRIVPVTTTWAELEPGMRTVLQDLMTAATGLLGHLIVSERAAPGGDGRVVLRITEVEAYGGGLDPGSHAYAGLSARNAAMFGPPLHAYVYRHMGLHTCMNIVLGDPGVPTGVLIRAGEIVEGAHIARARRHVRGVARRDRDLAAGPGRLTVALGITLADTGAPLDGSTGLTLVAQEPLAADAVMTGVRIGLSKAADFPLRAWVRGDPTVSRP